MSLNGTKTCKSSKGIQIFCFPCPFSSSWVTYSQCRERRKGEGSERLFPSLLSPNQKCPHPQRPSSYTLTGGKKIRKPSFLSSLSNIHAEGSAAKGRIFRNDLVVITVPPKYFDFSSPAPCSEATSWLAPRSEICQLTCDVKSCNLTHLISKTDWTYPSGGLVPARGTRDSESGRFLSREVPKQDSGRAGAGGRRTGWRELPQRCSEPLHQSASDSLSPSQLLIADSASFHDPWSFFKARFLSEQRFSRYLPPHIWDE